MKSHIKQKVKYSGGCPGIRPVAGIEDAHLYWRPGAAVIGDAERARVDGIPFIFHIQPYRLKVALGARVPVLDKLRLPHGSECSFLI
jgi:hypothetical protein